jgi:polysaccharide deacetylase family protein (PEP-CTERM system associated)
MTLAHALTVDVEDWFQVLNLRAVVDRSEWDALDLRCGDSTRRLLDLFAAAGAKATFFFLGWVAERLPELVREVAAAGHEIGSHGYDHQLLDELGRDHFDGDLERTEKALADAAGIRPRVFRACTWSIRQNTLWALPILAARGYRVDSSIYPVRHLDYGIASAPAQPYRIDCGAPGELLELPPLTWRVLGRRVPVGGGGYLRLFPIAMLAAGLRQQERLGVPGCVYLHPWEVDPGQPRVRIGGLRAFRHYVNLGRTAKKLQHLLQHFRFVGVEAALAQCDKNSAKWPAFSLNELSG